MKTKARNLENQQFQIGPQINNSKIMQAKLKRRKKKTLTIIFSLSQLPWLEFGCCQERKALKRSFILEMEQ
jgi:hypothetical protein